MQVEVWGGAGEHGRSCYYVQFGQRSVLLDCGVKKGPEDMYPLLDAAKVRELTTVFLSHAHEDHSMAIPLLVRHGYNGVVWTTRSTVHQLQSYYASWQKYVRDAGKEMPYTAEHIEQVRYRFLEDVSAPGQWFSVEPGIEACWGPSGHLTGSVWFLLKVEGQTLFYSGDYSPDSRLLSAILPAPEHVQDLSFAIMDAAYADDETEQQLLIETLVETCRQVLDRGGHVWLPVPMFGRGHEMIEILAEAFPDIQILCDEQLEKGFQALCEDELWLQADKLHAYKQMWSSRVQVLNQEQVMGRSILPERTIFLSADPMLQSRASGILLEACRAREENAILLTGHVYPGTRAARLLAEEKPGFEVVRCRYKIHQGLPDVRRMLDQLRPKSTLLVHAPKAKTDRLQTKLIALGYDRIYSCVPGDTIIMG
ncbi:MAG TPA: MBL fold metallo-hydrolase [Brevibacillus sp.]|nr:MBL fold metallo-hydrolase [Brevibacillus sp.]